MKIRIKGNSLRYRLTKTDVDNFLKNDYLEERTNFGDQQLIYALQKSESNMLEAIFNNNKITLLMPTAWAKEWEATGRVGFRGNHGELFLLIEKDFKCLDDVTEDQSDNYPNPLAQS
ncbi:hypothetical protein [Mucilaginibacter sp. dw_454]|uniref:DUF7009 family protein n=1 Tax=Mucilaginibacter sp. dw_454 TaxID=2720079 RepID=UPI001BD37C97|nr:hypothetical protein [Mucilaginibacter sp. dw_454]